MWTVIACHPLLIRAPESTKRHFGLMEKSVRCQEKMNRNERKKYWNLTSSYLKRCRSFFFALDFLLFFLLSPQKWFACDDDKCKYFSHECKIAEYDWKNHCSHHHHCRCRRRCRQFHFFLRCSSCHCRAQIKLPFEDGFFLVRIKHKTESKCIDPNVDHFFWRSTIGKNQNGWWRDLKLISNSVEYSWIFPFPFYSMSIHRHLQL